jgi:hypothetical protein
MVNTDEAEARRLRRALQTGPWRRMREARARGEGLEKGDVWAARVMVGWLQALETGTDAADDPGRTEDGVLGRSGAQRSTVGMDEGAADGLALDRIEGRD